MRYYQSIDDGVSEADREVGNAYVSRLEPEERSEESAYLAAPSIGGTYYYVACVEPVGEERDTENNCSEVLALSIGSPDLVVESVSFSDPPGSRASTSGCNATVRNQGTAESGFEGTTVRYYRSTDATIRLGPTPQVDHGVRQPPGSRRAARERVGVPDGPVERGHLLLRGLRGRSSRGDRHGEQLLRGRNRNYRESGPGGGISVVQREPGSGPALPAAGHGAQPGHRSGRGHHGALLPVHRRDDQLG